MAGATETRTSPPFGTDDGALELALNCSSPLSRQDTVIDATRLRPGDAAEIAVQAMVDWDRVRSGSGVPGPFRIICMNRCGSTRWSSISIDEARAAGVAGSETIDWIVELPRPQVAGMVECEVAIVLAVDREEDIAIAHRTGSIISRQSFGVRFDKGGFEFPTKWISFSALGYPPDALWTLRVQGDDWTDLPEDVVEVQLNEDQTDFKRLLDFPSSKERLGSDLLRRLIVCDALSDMVLRFLTSDSVDDIEMNGDRLCDVIARMIDRRFPEDLETLRTKASTDPARIRMYMQGIAGLGESMR